MKKFITAAITSLMFTMSAAPVYIIDNITLKPAPVAAPAQ